VDAVAYATLTWVDWFNHRRLLESIGHVPPAEYERAYYRPTEGQAMLTSREVVYEQELTGSPCPLGA
jgi:hypothetical protein